QYHGHCGLVAVATLCPATRAPGARRLVQSGESKFQREGETGVGSNPGTRTLRREDPSFGHQRHRFRHCHNGIISCSCRRGGHWTSVVNKR
ncbi:hypothetical protein L9F63_008114, partial [Diploptera punctata]